MKPIDSLPIRIIRGGWRRATRWTGRALHRTLTALPWFHFVRGTAAAQNPCLLRYWFWQKLIGINRGAYWPVHFSSRINQPQNVLLGVDCAPGYEPGCYVQAIGPVIIGDYTQVAANVGIIGANHDLTDLRRHTDRPGVRIGSYCWLGMGCVILPGVTLGDFTVVGANAVVTKSFPDGYCVLAGSPARPIRQLDPQQCLRYRNEVEYHGYVRRDRFEAFRQRHLRV